MGNRGLTVAAIAVATLSTTVAVAPAAQAHPQSHIRLLGEQIVPKQNYGGTPVGGLSSIDYNPRTGSYAFTSDDRSDKAPARWYTAKIPVSSKGLGPVTFTGTHAYLRPDGTTYPPLSANDPSQPQTFQTVDPEEARFDPQSNNVTWSQEGERSGSTLIDPSVRDAAPDGKFVRQLPLPANERMLPESGPRQNEALEGFTYAKGGRLITTATEDALLQDGPDATPDKGSVSRLTVQTRQGKVLSQYAYQQEPIFARPSAGGSGNNGVPSILAVDPQDPDRYLVLERAFVSGAGNKIRIFEVDTAGATNVKDVPSLASAKVEPVRKRLVADLADFKLSTVDNVEGMTWGPTLPSGERTLLLVSDNNFSDSQVTQVIALAVR